MKRKEIVAEIKTAPKRTRKKREPKPIPLGFKPGDIVKVSSPNNFRGYKLGFVMEACKYDDGITVYLTNNNSVPHVCIRPEVGDTIERITNE